MSLRTCHLSVGFLITATILMVDPSQGQSPTAPLAPDRPVPTSATLSLLRQPAAMWRSERVVGGLLSDSAAVERPRVVAVRREGDGAGQAGVLIGGVLGVVACRSFVQGMSDQRDASCSLMGNVASAAVGAILGGLIGSLIK